VEKCRRTGQATDDNITHLMRIACCIPKAKDTHSDYVIIFASLLQHWLHERASVLRCTYTARTRIVQEENCSMELVI
jgi:hypothetical protein